MIVQSEFKNGESGYQVTFDQKTYWITPKGELEEYIPIEHLFEYNFRSLAEGALAQELVNSYQSFKSKFQESFSGLEEFQQGAVLLAEALLREADERLAEKREEEARELLGWSRLGLDLTIAVAAGEPTNIAIGLSEAIFAKDIHGRSLTKGERVFSLAVCAIGGRQIWAPVLEKVTYKIKKLTQNRKLVIKVEQKAIEEAPEVARDVSIVESGVAQRYTKAEYQGSVKVGGETRDVSRRVYQRNDIDWRQVDPESGLTNLDLAKRGLTPYS